MWAQATHSLSHALRRSTVNEAEGSDPLQPVLHEAQSELRRRLREACEAEAGDVANESSAEIRRLEDALLAAAVAAKHTIALREHIEQKASQRQEEASQPEHVSAVREFRDANGARWRAWPVIPGSAQPGRKTQRYLGEFHKGWVCFESLESSARRRLPQQPPRWHDLNDAELTSLLEQAISAPERTKAAKPGSADLRQ